MANRKKLTMKQVEGRLDTLLRQNIMSQNAIENLHRIVVHYIKFNKNEKKFQKYIEKIIGEENESSKQNDSKKSSARDKNTKKWKR